MPSDSSNPEVDLGLGKVSEVTKEQVEQFQEQLRQAQAALAALQKEEGKAKKKDFALAGLLNGFLKSNKDTDVLQLVVKCLEMNVPVNVIVGILSLAYVEIYNQLAEELKKEIPNSKIKSQNEDDFLEAVEQEEEKDLKPKQAFDAQTLPEEVKNRINEWVRDIIILSFTVKEKTLETTYAEGVVKKVPLALTTNMLRKYLESVEIDGEDEKVAVFAAFVLNGVGKELGK